MRKVTSDTYPCPTLYLYYHQEDSKVVAVDILRAGASMMTAFDRGAKEITLVATTEEVESFLGKDYVVAVERNATRCPWAGLGNDLSEFTAERISGRNIVFTTTNDVQTIHAARETGAAGAIIGVFSNLTTATRHCQASGHAVTVLASGWQNSFYIEDTLYGAASLDKLKELGTTHRLTDNGRTALELYRQHRARLYNCFYNYDHSQRLVQRGYPESLRLCLE